MLKKKLVYIIIMTICILTTATGFLLRLTPISYRPLEGFLIGIGMGCFFATFSQYLTKIREEKNPKVKRENEINLSDERNIMLRNHAKAKSGDIVQWILIIVAMVSILFDAPMYFTGIIVLIYTIKAILDLYFIGYFDKRM